MKISIKESEEAKIEDLTLPRIYFDSDTLIDALLVERKSLEEKEKEKKEDAKRLYENWRGPPIRVSPFTIGEFIAIGRKDKYGYCLQQLLEIVSNEINPPKFELIYAEISEDSEIITNINSTHRWLFASFEVEGDATLNGSPIGKRNFGMGLDVKKYLWTKGLPSENEKLIFTKIDSVKYTAPYFELVLFKKASEIAIKSKIALGDAIHLVYATPDKVDVLLTNDKKFLKVDKKNSNGIKIKRPRYILDQYPQILKGATTK